MTGDNLSINRRITTGVSGTTGLVTLLTGGAITDFIINGVADKLSKGDADKTLHVKNSASIIELLYNINQIRRGKVPSSNTEIIGTQSTFINSLINNFSGNADSKLKDKEKAEQ